MQVRKQQNLNWNNGQVPNWERSISRLLIVTLAVQYVEYIMRNTRVNEAQAGIKISRKNINVKYADNITFMSESE